MKIIERVIERKKESGAPDLEHWYWLQSLFEGLGEEGVSSDESDFDADTAQEVYYVRDMEWRADISDEITIVERQRKADLDIFGKQGAKPVVRLRGGKRGKSTRDAPEGLAKALYNRTWIRDMPSTKRKKFKVSGEKFEWRKLAA